MVLLLLRDLLLFGLLFALPGWLVAQWLLPDDGIDLPPDPLERAVVALGAGFGGVSVLAFTGSLLTLTHLGWVHVALAGALISGRALWGLRRAGEAARRAPDRPAGLALGLIAVVFAVYLVNYDRAHFQYGCIHTVVQLALDDSVAIGSPFTDAGTPQERLLQQRRRVDPNPVRAERETPPEWMNPLVFIGDTGQRYGTTAMIAPAAAVHGFLGFRLTYALHAALLVGFLLLLGRRLTGSDRLAALAAGLAALNPWLLKISLLDENLMSATWAAGALVMATRVRPAAALAGLFCGLAIGIRHIDLGLAVGVAGLVIAPALMASARAGRRAAGALALGLLCALLHEAVHHQVAYGTLLSHEHFVDEVWFSTEYTLFGRAFDYAGLLNWPFADQLIRTPYNGLPTALLIPVSISAHLGTLLVALAVAGLASVTRREPAIAAAVGVWSLPIVALHGVMEDWLDPNKMGIPVTLLPVLAIGIAAGLGLVRRRPRSAALVVVGALVLSAGVRGAGSIDVPDDPAFYAKYPLVRVEQPVYAVEDRMRWTRGNLLPDWRWVAQHSPLALGSRFVALGEELGERTLRQGPRPPLQVEATRGEQRLTLDLTEPLVGRRDFLMASADDPDPIDLTAPGAAALIEDLDLPWADRPAALLAVHDPGQRIRLFLRFGLEDFGDFESVDGFTIDARSRAGVRRIAGAHRLAFLIPDPAVIEVAETVSLDQVLIYRWDGTAVDSTVRLSDWRKLFHN